MWLVFMFFCGVLSGAAAVAGLHHA